MQFDAEMLANFRGSPLFPSYVQSRKQKENKKQFDAGMLANFRGSPLFPSYVQSRKQKENKKQFDAGMLAEVKGAGDSSPPASNWHKLSELIVCFPVSFLGYRPEVVENTTTFITRTEMTLWLCSCDGVVPVDLIPLVLLLDPSLRAGRWQLLDWLGLIPLDLLLLFFP